MGCGAAGNILITSAASKAPLVRAMKSAASRIVPSAAVIAGDADPGAPARYAADSFWEMPSLADTCIEALLQGCRERDIGIVLPTRDAEIAFWAAARSRFAEAGIDVLVSSPDSVGRCLDKLAFAQFGQANGMPFIPAALDIGDLAHWGAPGDFFVVKERFGAGSRRIGVNLDRDDALAHARDLEAPIFQPYVAGTEVSIDAWMNRRCEPVGVVLRRRDRVVHGESQVTTTFRDSAMESLAMEVFCALQLRGPCVIQAIVVPSGSIKVIECNCRFGGASTASIAAGLDMLAWSLAERYAPAMPPIFRRIAGELRQVRLPEDLVLRGFDL